MILLNNFNKTVKLPLFILQFLILLLLTTIIISLYLYSYYSEFKSQTYEIIKLETVNRIQEEEINIISGETKAMREELNEIESILNKVKEQVDLDLEEITREENNINIYEFSNGLLNESMINIHYIEMLYPTVYGELLYIYDYLDKIYSKPIGWPITGRISSPFGTRNIPYADGLQFHTGVDILGSVHSSIVSTGDGEVIFAGWRGSYGKLIIIDHGYGYQTYYAHLSEFFVSVGDKVQREDRIGRIGDTGSATGIHLHYEVRYNNIPKNPYPYMKRGAEMASIP